MSNYTDAEQALIKELSTFVIQRRRKLNLSQEKLAEMSGLTRNYISLIECCDTNPSLISLRRIASALDCSLADVIDAIEKE
jgi:transcriptional regulator with XRE-family HTH domain